MIDQEIVCNGPREMVETARQTIYERLGKLKYVNLKYKCAGERESAWLYNVAFQINDGNLGNKRSPEGEAGREDPLRGMTEGAACVIRFLNADADPISVPLAKLEYLKLRPYYIATCVGFKNIIFYSKGDQRSPLGGSQASEGGQRGPLGDSKGDQRSPLGDDSDVANEPKGEQQ